MGSWSVFLMALAAPIAKRVAIALGFGFIAFEGAAAVLESAFSAAQSALGGLMAEVSALLAMAGMFDAMAIAAGSLVASLSWVALKKFGVLT